MLIVLGSVLARSDSFEEMRRLALEHVARSRLEAGCLSHAVHTDLDEPLRLCFVERWADRAALAAHFQVPASAAFVRAMAQRASQPPEMTIYEAGTVLSPAAVAAR